MVRGALFVAGLAATAYGAVRLLQLGWDNLVATVVWLAGGVVAHDGLLAPATLAVCAVGTILLPREWRGVGAAVLVVLGTVTVSAVPVLGRFGARPDNPTLLDRPYWTGWLVFATLVVGGAVLAHLLGRLDRRGRAQEKGSDGTDPRRR